MVTKQSGEKMVQQIWALLEQVMDPEIPNISIVELGMVREVVDKGGRYEVIITPTFSGCPAKEVILRMVSNILEENDICPVEIKLQLSPPWTVEDIDKKCFPKLKEVGIAPPVGESMKVQCPLCNSVNVKQISFYGATSCKSQFSCLDCLEPFEYFKGIKKRVLK